jgi:hypothetical protein
MRERTNIPITTSVLHDQEYYLYQILQHLNKRRRAFTERQAKRDPTVRSKGQQAASIQMIRQEVDA